MQLNQATDYAFRVVLHLAGAPDGEIVSGQVIAQAEAVPARFLQKIMRSLLRAGIVRSWRGVDGGFALARPPCDISLYDIVAAMEGPIVLNRCLNEFAVCSRRIKIDCAVHRALDSIQESFIANLRTVNFAHLLNESQSSGYSPLRTAIS